MFARQITHVVEYAGLPTVLIIIFMLLVIGVALFKFLNHLFIRKHIKILSIGQRDIEKFQRSRAALISSGYKAVNPLIDFLNRKGKYERGTFGEVIKVLGDIGGSRAVDFLTNVLYDPEFIYCIHFAEESLIQNGISRDNLIKMYKNFLLGASRDHQFHAIRRLAEMGDTDSIECIERYLSHNDKYLQMEAVRSLILLEQKELTHPLFEQYLSDLSSGNAKIRGHAVAHIRTFQNKRAIPPLINCLNDRDISIVRYAEASLENLEATYEQMIRGYIFALQSNNPSVRYNAEEKLSDLNASRELLTSGYSLALVSPHDAVRRNAFEKLKGFGRNIYVRVLSSNLEQLKGQDLVEAMDILHSLDAAPTYYDILEKLRTRIPEGKHFTRKSQVASFLSEALRLREQGFDFRVDHQEEIGHINRIILYDSNYVRLTGSGEEANDYNGMYGSHTVHVEGDIVSRTEAESWMGQKAENLLGGWAFYNGYRELYDHERYRDDWIVDVPETIRITRGGPLHATPLMR